jgi:hypothetical protein
VNMLVGSSPVMRPEDIIANAAVQVAQRAWYGRLQPTAKRDGGRA